MLSLFLVAGVTPAFLNVLVIGHSAVYMRLGITMHPFLLLSLIAMMPLSMGVTFVLLLSNPIYKTSGNDLER